ncbi:cytochrome P450 [Russula emetica]|nr:cytochrome P450 [Russula emetica]
MLDDYTLRVSFLGGFLVLISFFVSRYFGLSGDPVLDAIPTVGFSDPILSHLSALQFHIDSVSMLKEGYEKTRPGLFKIPNFWRWMVLASGPELMDDIRRAPPDVLSRRAAFNEAFQAEYTIGLLNPKDEYSTEIIRSKFTRDVASTFKEVHEELIMAIDDLIPETEHKWIKVPFLQTAQRLVCRATNRVFVGVPLCRDRDYQNLNLGFAVNVVIFGTVISLFPKPIKLILSRMLSNLPSKIQQEVEFIRPIVEERFAKMEEYGKDWDDKPNDMLMWLMTEAKGAERSVEGIARRMLVTNFAGIHATSLASTATQVLYRLLANPEYLKPLREEVDAVIKEQGWTKAGMDKMYKIDSFLRETLRLSFVTLPSNRLALRPFTFSNGVTVPAGTIISIPASSTHTDERIYSNPNEFDGFRFEKLRKIEQDTTTSKYQTVSASSEHLAFGVGRHTCPGRFLAVNEIKGLFAYIVATYDIKFEEGQSGLRGSRIGGYDLRLEGHSILST